jgi:hypothetical protein
MRVWLILAMLATSLNAGLMENTFPGKTEAEVASEFEQALPAFIEARMPENIKPRIRITHNRRELFLQCIEVKDEATVWQELVRISWLPESLNYMYDVEGETFEFKTLELPPDQIASWFIARYRPNEEMVRLAVWLAVNGHPMLANAKLAELVSARSDVKPYVDAWLCEKLGWTLPEDGLKLIETVDVAQGARGHLLLTAQANEARKREIESGARAALRELESIRGDIRGRAGTRGGSPKMRLDMLQKYVERFEEVYGETSFMQNRRNRENFTRIKESVAEDLAHIETEQYKADRLGIDGDWAAAARAWEALRKTDPENPEVIRRTAEAYTRSAAISGGGSRAENPQAARTSAMLYDRLIEIYPRVLAYRNHAGYNWLAAGDKNKARGLFESVLQRTEGRPELTDAEKQNREFAENRLKDIR